jgi:hypothetical protein
MIHPDADLRAHLIQQAVGLIGLVPSSAPPSSPCAPVPETQTTCGGPTRATPKAWSDLRHRLVPLLEAAGDPGIRLGVEPELANVVLFAQLARLGPVPVIVPDASEDDAAPGAC